MCEAAEVAAETGASAGFGRFGAALLLDDAASEARFGGPKDNNCWANGIGGFRGSGCSRERLFTAASQLAELVGVGVALRGARPELDI